METNRMTLYAAYNPITDTYYIGKTINALNQRQSQHRADAKLHRNKSWFHKAIRKYGYEVFEWSVISEHDCADELSIAEIQAIKHYRENGYRLYNLTDGGDGGDVGGSKYWKEHDISEETKAKISKSLKEYYATHENHNKGKKRGISWNKGLTKKDHPGIKRISELKMGVSRSEEVRQKLRSANLGNKLKPHVIEILKEKFSGKNNPSAKSVICVTTGEYFDYAKLAALKYDVDLSSIIKCCRGKLKTVGGMKFIYTPQGWKKL